MNRRMNGAVIFMFVGGIGLGCEDHERVYVRRPPPPPPQEVIVADGPVIDGPGVEVVQVEPPPPERVYVYDPGFPPGVYYYHNYYWYRGYRYPRDVFVRRYVDVNVHQHRYVNVEENRRYARPIEVQHREDYRVYHGHPPHHDDHDHH